MKKIIVVVFALLISIQASAKEDLVNIDSLISAIEILQNNIKKLNEKIDNVSNQSHKTKKATVTNQKRIKTLTKKISLLSKQASSRAVLSCKTKDDNKTVQDKQITEEAQYYRVNAKSGVVIHQKASEKSLRIGTIHYYDTVYALCTKKLNWCYLPDMHGYISKNFIKKTQK